MKKIVFVTGSQARTGGTERVCADISNYLSRIDDYKVTILSLYEGKASGFPVDDKVSLDELSSKKKTGYLSNLYFSTLLAKYVIKNKPDVLIGVESLIFLNMLSIALLPDRPKLVCWEHFNLEVNLGISLRDSARQLATIFADRIIVLSKEDEKKWKTKFKYARKKVSHIYNPSPFQNIGEINVVSTQKQKVVFAAGRLTYQKGFDLLIKSWSLLPRELRTDWTLKIAGEGEDRSKLEEMIADYHLSDSVYLLGHNQDIVKEYELASIFALSSRFEGFGLVLLEALKYELPVVSYNCPAGPSEIVFDGINGYLVENGDFVAFSEQLKVLMENTQILNEMKDNTAYNMFRFDSNVITTKWHELMNQLL